VLTGFNRADSIASLIVVVLMAYAAWGLLRDAGRILLQAAPDSLVLADIRSHLCEVPHVLDVHDLHVWTVSSGSHTLSAHVIVEDHCFVTGHARRSLTHSRTVSFNISTLRTRRSNSSPRHTRTMREICILDPRRNSAIGRQSAASAIVELFRRAGFRRLAHLHERATSNVVDVSVDRNTLGTRGDDERARRPQRRRAACLRS